MGIKVQKPSVHESAIKLPPMAAECTHPFPVICETQNKHGATVTFKWNMLCYNQMSYQ